MTQKGTYLKKTKKKKTLNKYLSTKNESYLDEELAKKNFYPQISQSIAKFISYPLQLDNNTIFLRKPSYMCY